jgi:hypothetical protein
MQKELRIRHGNELEKKDTATTEQDQFQCVVCTRISHGAFQGVVNLDVAESVVDQKGGAYAREDCE